MALDYSKYLDVEVDNITPEKHLPLGHYFADIISWKTATRNYKDERGDIPVVELTFKTTSPDDDVIESDLPDNGGVGVLLTKDYGLATPVNGKVEGGGQAQLRRLAEDTLGLHVKGLKLPDVLDALRNQPCRVYNEPRPDKNDDTRYYNQVKKVLSAQKEEAESPRRKRG